jgi:deoxyribonuclease-1
MPMREPFYKCLLLSVLISVMVSNSLPYAQSPKTFAQAKRQLRILFGSHHETLYCHCAFDNDLRVDLASCGMQAASAFKRASRVEWEHMMPAENFGYHFACWREPLCVKKNGKTYRGRACCKKIDTLFRQAEAELYNLWPAVGLVNQARSNYRYGVVDLPPDFYGCSMRISTARRRAVPPDYSKGTVARANLFMSDHYHIVLSEAQRKLFTVWTNQFPANRWEKTWAAQIASIEGYRNPYIN